MQVELKKQIFNKTRGFKIHSIRWCCDRLKNNPIIGLFDEYAVDNTEEEESDTPGIMLQNMEVVKSYEDEWEEYTYYRLNFCPFCGEQIHVSIIKEEDISDQFEAMNRSREELRKMANRTDSKKKERELNMEIRKINDKIESFYELCEEAKEGD